MERHPPAPQPRAASPAGHGVAGSPEPEWHPWRVETDTVLGC